MTNVDKKWLRTHECAAPVFVEKFSEKGFRAFFQFFNNLGNGAPAAVKFAVGAGKRLDAFFGEAFRMQPQGMQVQRTEADGVAGCLGARRNVAVDLVRATHECVGTHLIALLDGGNATDSRIFTDTHVAAQLAAVCDNDARADVTVMGDMRIGHHQDLVGHMGATAPLHRTSIERAIFADGAVFANFETGWLTRVL